MKDKATLWLFGTVIAGAVIFAVTGDVVHGLCHGVDLKTLNEGRPAFSCFEFWFYRYQTLLIGLIASGLATASFLGLMKQIRIGNRQVAPTVTRALEERAKLVREGIAVWEEMKGLLCILKMRMAMGRHDFACNETGPLRNASPVELAKAIRSKLEHLQEASLRHRMLGYPRVRLPLSIYGEILRLAFEEGALGDSNSPEERRARCVEFAAFAERFSHETWSIGTELRGLERRIEAATIAQEVLLLDI